MMGRKVRVVLIDDDKDDFFIVQDLLREVPTARYEVSWISDFEEALESVRLQQADVYLVDYRLGGRTGFELLDQGAGLGKKPMILLTNESDHEVDFTAMSKGAADFLSKRSLTVETLESSLRYSIKGFENQERIRAIEKLKAEKEAAEAANRAKGRYLAVMSHELRTPLGAIMGFVDLAMDPSIRADERNEFLAIVRRNGAHLLSLIDDVLDLEKVDAGRLDVQREKFNWREVVDDVLALMEPSARLKGLSLNRVAETGLSEFVHSDAKRFRQILINLLGNALKFTPQGSVTVEVRSDEAQGGLAIAVRDTGIGMGGVEQSRLFQDFVQGTSGTDRKFGGTGLGLSLSRKLARILGGDLQLTRSAPHEGTIFTWTLPCEGLEFSRPYCLA